jgi:hypothetical protein
MIVAVLQLGGAPLAEAKAIGLPGATSSIPALHRGPDGKIEVIVFEGPRPTLQGDVVVK